MRRIAVVFVLGLACLGGYIASPLVAAWSIKEAIESGDSAYLKHRVDWAPVKASLKLSLGEMTLGPQLASAEAASDAAKPGLWQRLKTGYARYVVNGLVDRYATPTGLPTLFSYGRTVRHDIMGKSDPEKGMTFPEKLASNWARVTRAEFLSPTTFAMEMRDKYDQARVYQGVLVFEGLGWKLVDLRVKTLNAAGAALKLAAEAVKG